MDLVLQGMGPQKDFKEDLQDQPGSPMAHSGEVWSVGDVSEGRFLEAGRSVLGGIVKTQTKAVAVWVGTSR